jgi:hypothetical protein
MRKHNITKTDEYALMQCNARDRRFPMLPSRMYNWGRKRITKVIDNTGLGVQKGESG